MGFIILAIITFGVGMIAAYFKDDDFLSLCLLLIWGVLMMAIVSLPSYIDFERTEVKVEDTEIVALKDNTNAEGSFFLGTGSVSGVDYYYYMEDGIKGLSVSKVPVESSHIKEVEDGEHKLETYKLEMKSAFAEWFYDAITEDRHEYIFHVPEGSIEREFKVGME